MHRIPCITVSFFFTLYLLGLSSPGTAQEKFLQAFENLVGSTWVSAGEQLGGHQGKTEKVLEYGLDGKIIKVKTYATHPETKEFGLRNEGIRVWNAADSLVYFYEFDSFGGITSGLVTTEGKNIHYAYQYHGLDLRDSWVYIDENTYAYTVGVWKDGAWEKKYHQAEFVRKGE